MRAVIVKAFGAISNADVEEIRTPEPGRGEIQVQVEAAGVNYPDILVMEGNYQNKPDLPFAPGKEVAGTVSKVGPEVTEFEVGDRIAAQVEYGGYAEYVVANASDCFKTPELMPSVDAAAFGLSFQTAYFALLNRAGFQPGESVLVTGATGGFGLAALQLVKALGGIAIAGTRDMDNAPLAKANGADHVIDLSREPLRDSLREQVWEATGGRGVDIVLDPVGGAVFEASLRTLDWCGRLVVVGFATGDIPTVRANYLLVKNIAVMGLQWSDYRDRSPEVVREAQMHLYRLFEENKIRARVDSVSPLNEFAEVLERVRRGEVNGKAVLRIKS